MRVVGLTGGVGMGKTATGDCLARMGERVIDTDLLAREAVGRGTPGLESVRKEFGARVVGTDGLLDRVALAAMVFGDPERRRVLEGILHPIIRAAWEAKVEEARADGLRQVIVVIPLLFETSADQKMDRTICVACSADTQRERLFKRGWTSKEIENRKEAQWPVSRKMDAADRVIWSEGPLDLLAEQAERALKS